MCEMLIFSKFINSNGLLLSALQPCALKPVTIFSYLAFSMFCNALQCIFKPRINFLEV